MLRPKPSSQTDDNEGPEQQQAERQAVLSAKPRGAAVQEGMARNYYAKPGRKKKQTVAVSRVHAVLDCINLGHNLQNEGLENLIAANRNKRGVLWFRLVRMGRRWLNTNVPITLLPQMAKVVKGSDAWPLHIIDPVTRTLKALAYAVRACEPWRNTSSLYEVPEWQTNDWNKIYVPYWRYQLSRNELAEQQKIRLTDVYKLLPDGACDVDTIANSNDDNLGSSSVGNMNNDTVAGPFQSIFTHEETNAILLLLFPLHALDAKLATDAYARTTPGDPPRGITASQYASMCFDPDTSHVGMHGGGRVGMPHDTEPRDRPRMLSLNQRPPYLRVQLGWDAEGNSVYELVHRLLAWCCVGIPDTVITDAEAWAKGRGGKVSNSSKRVRRSQRSHVDGPSPSASVSTAGREAESAGDSSGEDSGSLTCVNPWRRNVVMHLCEKPGCLCIKHLYWGTASENKGKGSAAVYKGVMDRAAAERGGDMECYLPCGSVFSWEHTSSTCALCQERIADKALYGLNP